MIYLDIAEVKVKLLKEEATKCLEIKAVSIKDDEAS